MKNVTRSDATLILSNGELRGGSKLTLELAVKYDKPHLHIDYLKLAMFDAIANGRLWLLKVQPKTLNIAGSRASEDPRIYAIARDFLDLLFAPDTKNEA